MSLDGFEILVIGAGVSGLSAARRLAASGRRVCVLEARERTGGRTFTVSAQDGTPVDLGGQWLAPSQGRALALVAELGLQTFPQYHAGRKHMNILGRDTTYRGTIPGLPLFALIDLQVQMWRIEAAARRLDRGAPWSAGNARELDALSVEDWIARAPRTAETRALLRVATHALFATEPAQVSWLQFLFYARSAGAFRPLIEIPAGAQEQRVAGGMQAVSERLAELVRALGSEVRLGTPVQALRQDEDGIAAVTTAGEVRARRAIVAMSPQDSGRIAFMPQLPAPRRELQRQMRMGSTIKCVAIYQTPFWRAAGDSGEMISDGEPLRMSFDDTPPDGRHGALVGFILGEAAQRWSAVDPARRRAAVLAQWAAFFGPAAQQPLEYLELDWCREAWTHGCYVGLFAPGGVTGLARQLREPEGRVHWAGTETAATWNGYIDGAIEAGERAAAEVLALTG